MTDSLHDTRLAHPFLTAVRDRLSTADSLGPRRRAAAARFLDADLPGPRDEAWRFVRLKDMSRVLTEAAPTDHARIEQAQIEALGFGASSAARLVFVDGVFDERLSQHDDVAQGVTMRAFGADASFPEGIGSVAHTTGTEHDYFASLNEALFEQGASITVAPDCAGGTLHVLFITTGTYASMTHPRLYVQMGRGATCTVIEDHVSLSEHGDGDGGDGEHDTITNALVEVSVAEGARLDHVKLQRESRRATHIARTAADLQGLGAHYASVTMNLGAALCRHDLHADIDGRDTTCALHALALIDGTQVSDTHSIMHHVHPDALSDQLHKCVIGDRAHAVFNGQIKVEREAQRINAFQLNRNLLLSNGAHIHTKPQLEIFADDVKCSHGATIGQLDPEQLFYLQARGISPAQAQTMLTYAFAGEVIDRVPVVAVRQWLTEHVSSRMSEDRS